MQPSCVIICVYVCIYICLYKHTCMSRIINKISYFIHLTVINIFCDGVRNTTRSSNWQVINARWELFLSCRGVYLTSWLLKFILCLAHSLCHTHKQMQHPQSLFVLVLNLVTNDRTLIFKDNSMPLFMNRLFFSFCLSRMIFLSNTNNIQLPVLMTQTQGAWNPSFPCYWIKLLSETDSLSFLCKYFPNNFMKYRWRCFIFLTVFFSNRRKKERLPSQTIYETRAKQFPVFVFEIVINSAGSSTVQLKFNIQKQAWKCSQLKYWVVSV